MVMHIEASVLKRMFKKFPLKPFLILSLSSFFFL